MEFLKNIYNKYLCVNLKDYPNLGFDFEISKVLLFVTLGIIAAIFIIYNYQSKATLLIRKLMRSGAFDEDGAKSLSELNLADNKGVKKLLAAENATLRRIVRTVGEKRMTYDEYLALEKEKKTSKKSIFNRSKGKNGAPSMAENVTRGKILPCDAAREENKITVSPEAETPHNGENSASCGKTTAKGSTESASSTEKNSVEYPEKKFYIPSEMREYAEKQLARNNGSVLNNVLYSAVLILLYTAILFAMPSILSFINGLI